MHELAQRSVYKNQKIWFLRTIKASVRNVYVRGQKVQSAICSRTTKPIFRSESARYILFIQMSREMWDFDGGDSGEIMFSKVINGFLPELFRRWQQANVRHLVTIVLFTRMWNYTDPTSERAADDSGTNVGITTSRRNHQDFYRVVVSDATSGEWSDILARLKLEYKTFLRDISICRPTPAPRLSLRNGLAGAPDSSPEWVISGQPCIAAQGNILEAINLASIHFSYDHIDCDLVRTGVSVALITPGSGVFEVDHKLLVKTSKNLVANGVGIDLICLARMPLHSVPLFKYRQARLQSRRRTAREPQMRKKEEFGKESLNPMEVTSPKSAITSIVEGSAQSIDEGNGETKEEEWYYGVPHWIAVSFWTSPSEDAHSPPKRPKRFAKSFLPLPANGQRRTFRPRVRMRELQILGLADNAFADISLPCMIPLNPEKEALAQTTLVKKWLNLAPSPNNIEDVGSTTHSSVSSLGISPTLGGKVSPLSRKLYQYMTLYDEEVFSDPHTIILPSNKKPIRASRKRSAERSTNSKYLVPSPRTSGRGHKSPLQGKWQVPTDHTSAEPAQAEMTKKPSEAVTSAKSIKNESRVKINAFPRQISLGLRGFGLGTPKARASTEITAEYARPDSSLGQNLRTSLSEAAATAVSANQSGPSTARRPISTYSVDTISDPREQSNSSDSEAQGSSRPIPIRSSTAIRVSRHSDDSPSQDKDRPSKLARRDQQSFLSGSKSNLERGMDDMIDPDKNLQGDPIVEAQGSASSDEAAPWLTAVNPSKPRADSAMMNFSGRWQHLFPRPFRASKIRWKSLCSPAVVPITIEQAVDTEEWLRNCDQHSYRVDIPQDNELMERPRPSNWLLREMVALRLSYGYQIAVRSQVPQQEQVDVYDWDLKTTDASFLQLSRSEESHMLRSVEGKAIEVTRYIRSSQGMQASSGCSDERHIYKPFIRAMSAETYETRNIKILPHNEILDWRELDAFIALQGRSPSGETVKGLQFWCARFLLIPVDPPASYRRPFQSLNEDNEEEIRLEGIRKLTQMWQRFRYVPADERRFQAPTRRRNDTNPLDVIYQTRNPSSIVAAEKETMAENMGTSGLVKLLPESELFQRSNVSLDSLANTIQSEKGVRMMDRRWHWRLHYNCFIGFELTGWLLQNFRDIDSRDEAVEFGNQLMTDGLFQHVEQRHNFRDGNFFYQISSGYRTPRTDARTWFGSRKSVPPTPQSEDTTKDIMEHPTSRAGSDACENVDDEKSTSKGDKRTLGVALSKSMLYDVDHRKRSHRPELVTLHYDRLHNPDNCYHIRIDWLNVTPKLIEDAIISWGSTAERFGLKLVEAPIAEACTINEMHPFRAPHQIVLTRPPPDRQPEHQTYLDAKSFSTQPKPEKHYYQKLLLKKFDYVLDLEAAKDFPHNVDVIYSWGKPDFKYSQYIHRSGMLLAQISDEGNFLLLANRLYNNRSTAGHEASRAEDEETHDQTAYSARTAGYRSRTSPLSSPMIRPTSELTSFHRGSISSPYAIPEQLRSEFEAFCRDETALDTFYKEALNKSPLPGRRTPYLESTIPTLGLPPILSLRDGSPAPSENV